MYPLVLQILQLKFKQFLKNPLLSMGLSSSDTGGSGINRVEAYVQKTPINGSGRYILTTPVQEGNWSKWSFPITLNDAGSYIVKARVTGNAGEQDWADVTIVLPSHISTKKIGLIEPTFTYAAYRFWFIL